MSSNPSNVYVCGGEEAEKWIKVLELGTPRHKEDLRRPSAGVAGAVARAGRVTSVDRSKVVWIAITPLLEYWTGSAAGLCPRPANVSC